MLPPERERTSVVEATAVLVEALAIEAAVYADDGLALDYDVEVDWDLIRECQVPGLMEAPKATEEADGCRH